MDTSHRTVASGADRRTGNTHIPHVVCTVHYGDIVGCMPREISNVASYFLQHGGRIAHVTALFPHFAAVYDFKPAV